MGDLRLGNGLLAAPESGIQVALVKTERFGQSQRWINSTLLPNTSRSNKQDAAKAVV